MKRLAILSVFVLMASSAIAQDHSSHSGHDMAEADAVKSVIVSGYIEGMHINRDAAAAKAAFHPEFIMHVSRDGEVRQVTIDQWTSRLSGEKNEDEITYEFDFVDVTGPAAKAKIRVFRNGDHIFTDYFGLYKLDGEWKIINKMFAVH